MSCSGSSQPARSQLDDASGEPLLQHQDNPSPPRRSPATSDCPLRDEESDDEVHATDICGHSPSTMVVGQCVADASRPTLAELPHNTTHTSGPGMSQDLYVTDGASSYHQDGSWLGHDQYMSDSDDGGVAILEYAMAANLQQIAAAGHGAEPVLASFAPHNEFLSGETEDYGFGEDDNTYAEDISDEVGEDTSDAPVPGSPQSQLSDASQDMEVDYSLWAPQGHLPAPIEPAVIFEETPFLPLGHPPPNLEALPTPFTPSSIPPIFVRPDNLGLFDFLRYWAHYCNEGPARRSLVPDFRRVHKQSMIELAEVRYSDLNGDRCDFQGLDWTDMGTTRAAARSRRRATYANYVNKQGNDLWKPNMVEHVVLPMDNFYRFKRLTLRRDIRLAHFQLRSVLACPSRSQVFYSTRHGIARLNPLTKKSDVVLDLSETAGMGRAITALDAKHGVLVGGTFNGDICIAPLHQLDNKKTRPTIIEGFDGISNHIQIYTPRRSSSPVVTVACNDHAVRVYDLQAEEFILEAGYVTALNATAISPDRRLRILVGDQPNAIISDAETGDPLVELKGHRDNGFACSWSDDGWTVATGYQDKTIKIWDARHWNNANGESTPIASLWCDIAGARSLQFSPLGSGHPVLVAAEEADYLNVIDAKTFRTKQSFDFFGELGGVAFSDDGRELNTLISEVHRGGLVQLERCRTSSQQGQRTMLEGMELF